MQQSSMLLDIFREEATKCDLNTSLAKKEQITEKDSAISDENLTNDGHEMETTKTGNESLYAEDVKEQVSMICDDIIVTTEELLILEKQQATFDQAKINIASQEINELEIENDDDLPIASDESKDSNEVIVDEKNDLAIGNADACDANLTFDEFETEINEKETFEAISVLYGSDEELLKEELSSKESSEINLFIEILSAEQDNKKSSENHNDKTVEEIEIVDELSNEVEKPADFDFYAMDIEDDEEVSQNKTENDGSQDEIEINGNQNEVEPPMEFDFFTTNIQDEEQDETEIKEEVNCAEQPMEFNFFATEDETESNPSNENDALDNTEQVIAKEDFAIDITEQIENEEQLSDEVMPDLNESNASTLVCDSDIEDFDDDMEFKKNEIQYVNPELRRCDELNIPKDLPDAERLKTKQVYFDNFYDKRRFTRTQLIALEELDETLEDEVEIDFKNGKIASPFNRTKESDEMTVEDVPKDLPIEERMAMMEKICLDEYRKANPEAAAEEENEKARKLKSENLDNNSESTTLFRTFSFADLSSIDAPIGNLCKAPVERFSKRVKSPPKSPERKISPKSHSITPRKSPPRKSPTQNFSPSSIMSKNKHSPKTPGHVRFLLPLLDDNRSSTPSICETKTEEESEYATADDIMPAQNAESGENNNGELLFNLLIFIFLTC